MSFFSIKLITLHAQFDEINFFNETSQKFHTHYKYEYYKKSDIIMKVERAMT